MKKKNLVKLAIFCLLIILSAGCGRGTGIGRDNISYITVNDGYITSSYTVERGISVRKALKEGEISVAEGDEIQPALNKEISEEAVNITVDRHADVTLKVDGEKKDLSMTGKKVRDALEASDVKLHKYDLINHDKEAYLTDGMDIEVYRRYKVTIIADGKKRKPITEAKTVEELLKEQNITLGKHDRISPKLSKKIKKGTKVVIKRVEIKKEKKKEAILYSTTYQNDSSMKSGRTKVKRAGKNGEKEITYKVTYVDGKEEKREEVSSKVLKEPTDQIVLRGTKKARKKKRKKARYKTVMDCDGTVKRVRIK